MPQEFVTLLDLLHFVRHTGGHGPKAFCRLAEISSQLGASVQPLLHLQLGGFTLTADSYALRPALTGHSPERGSRD